MNDYPMPFFQNFSAQQQGVQQAMQQGNQLAQNALTGQQGGFDPIKMAQALRGDRSLTQDLQTVNALAPWTQLNTASQYGTDPYSEQSRMLSMQERGM